MSTPVTAVAGTVQAFFTERLIGQRRASPHTVAAYRDAIRLLLNFSAERTSGVPCRLDFTDLDAPVISAFLDHIEREVTDGGDNGATGDLGGHGHHKAGEAMDDVGGAVDGVKQPANHSAPAVNAGLLSQHSIVRPAGGDRFDEKALDGQVGVGDEVTAADLGPDPDGATRPSQNECASMDGKQYRERCQFSMSLQSASTMTV